MKLLMKEAIKKIKLTFGRFLSVFFIVALGVGFFAGIRGTSIDMLFTADSYYKEKNLMDMRLVSTLGFKEEDVDILKKLEEVKDVEASYYVDCMEASDAVRVLALTEKLNQISLVEGRMPKENNEVLGDSFIYRVGDKLSLDTENLKEKEVTVVGTIKSSMYVSTTNKGTTLIGNGKISAFIYTRKENFKSDIYTVIYLTGKNTSKVQAYTDEYQASLETLENNVEKKIETLKDRRYQEIRNQAEEELERIKKQVEKEKQKTESKLSSTKKELDQKQKELEKAQQEINKQEHILEQEQIKAENEIKKAKEQLEIGNKEYQSNINQYEDFKKQVEYLEFIYATGDPTIIDLIDEEQIIDLIRETLQDDTILIKGEPLLPQLQELSILLQEKLDTVKEELTITEQEIAKKEEQIKVEIQKNKASISSYRKKIENGLNQLEKGYKTYSLNYETFEIKFQDAYKNIEKNAKKIEEIEKPDIYTFNREDNTGYTDYKSDTTRINNIAKVFPVFFLLVAALVCLNTMSRMVEEDRGQMGIYKSLGFNTKQILFTYILYVAFATIFGSIIGLAIGCTVLPNVIYNVYSFMYVLPKLQYDNNLITMISTTFLMFLVTLSITLYSALSVLKETPAALLRPKAPKKGKKVFIEKITWIWKRLNFSFKVTTRNIFRYKKRIFMTIVGIAGCTALTLAGLGLKDSITGIVKMQFEEITRYNATIVLDKSYKTLNDEMKVLLKENQIEKPTLIYQELFTYKIDGKNNDVYVVVPSSEDELKQYVTLRHRNDKKDLNIDKNGIILTEKMAENLNKKVGDIVEIYDANNQKYNLKINEICENYAWNYIYLTDTYYKEIFKKDINYNVIISDVSEKANFDKISTNLLNSNKILNVTFLKDTLKRFNDMVNNLNKIVLVILICSCLLAFIVLYNLTTINITERIREIATLKVLGFNDFEVSMYVYRETIILTIFGAFVGLILGILLHQFVITSAEMEFIMFQRNINGISYIYAFIITMIFSLIISVFTHFKLKKINMIEALKSVE